MPSKVKSPQSADLRGFLRYSAFLLVTMGPASLKGPCANFHKPEKNDVVVGDTFFVHVGQVCQFVLVPFIKGIFNYRAGFYW